MTRAPQPWCMFRRAPKSRASSREAWIYGTRPLIAVSSNLNACLSRFRSDHAWSMHCDAYVETLKSNLLPPSSIAQYIVISVVFYYSFISTSRNDFIYLNCKFKMYLTSLIVALRYFYLPILLSLQLCVRAQSDSTPPCYDICIDAYNTALTNGQNPILCAVNSPFYTKLNTCEQCNEKNSETNPDTNLSDLFGKLNGYINYCETLDPQYISKFILVTYY